MDASQISEIIALYERHGWKLRRVLMSPGLRKAVGECHEGLLRGVEPVASDIDAAWFSRSSRPGDETWEIRRLSPEPFALCEVFSDEDEDETREEVMSEMQAKLAR